MPYDTMDFHIDDIRQFLKSSLPDEQIDALKILIATYDECTNELANYDESQIYHEYERILSKLNTEGYHLTDDELDYGCEIESKVRAIAEFKETIRETTYTLRALEHFLKGDDRHKVLQRLSKEPWRTKHEVLSRYLWISSQHEERQKGRSFNRLYLCEVGSKIHRKTLDREYHILLRFLPQYCAIVGREYLVYKKQKPPAPDFLLQAQNGEYLAVEITETTSGEQHSFEQKQREILNRRLMHDFKNKQLTLTFINRPNWSVLNKRYEKVREWLDNILSELAFPEGEKTIDLRNDEIGILFWASKSDNDFLVFDMSGEGSGAGYIGDSIEAKVCSSVLSIIRKKSEKRYESESPYILVIYDNTSLPDVNFELVSEKVRAQLASSKLQWSFSDVWLSDESSAISVINLSSSRM